jgi:hypothetical protein
LFFEKGEPTKKIWYYQLSPGRNFGKKNPLNDADLADFLSLQKTKADSANSWTVDLGDVDRKLTDLTVRNPNRPADLGEISVSDLLGRLAVGLDAGSQSADRVRMDIKQIADLEDLDGDWVALGEVCEIIAGQSPEGRFYNTDGRGTPFYQGKREFTERTIGSPSTWTTEVTKMAIPGDILMSVRAPVGPVNLCPISACIGRGLAAIRPSDRVDGGFLFLQLRRMEKTIAGSEGAIFPSINKAQIEGLRIWLPGIESQRTIVALIEALQHSARELDLALRTTSDAARALVSRATRMLTGGLDSDDP